jgi:expansin (peptidoglycan-binding protein)
LQAFLFRSLLVTINHIKNIFPGNVGTNCDNGETTIMMVTDSCPECHAGDLDLSNGAWDKITGNASPSRFKASWNYIQCPLNFMMDKEFEFFIKEGSSQWWFAVMPLNHKNKVKSVEVKKNGSWSPMEFGKIDSFYWLATNLSSSFDLRFTLVNGKSIVHKVTNPGGNQYVKTGKIF